MTGKSYFTILILILMTTFTQAQKRSITPEDLWSFTRLGSYDISADGSMIVASVTNYDIEANKGNSDIWIMNSDGTNLKLLRSTIDNESNPVFDNKNKKVLYSYKGQIWRCNYDGTGEEQVTDLYTGAGGQVLPADGSSMLFTSMLYPECETQNCNKKIDEQKKESKVTARVFTELMYRHWNDWRGEKRSCLYLMENGKEPVNLTPNNKYDVPPIALGSGHDYDISPDGSMIAYTQNRDDLLAASTNNDVFLLKKGETAESAVKISESLGNDNQPHFSPNGKLIAFRSMERAGFEADKSRLAVYNIEDKTVTYPMGSADISIGEIIWAPDSKTVYYTSEVEINSAIYKYKLDTKENILVLGTGVNSGITLSPDGDKIYFKHQRSHKPEDLYRINTDGSGLEQLTKINDELLSQIEMKEAETFWAEGAEGAKVQSIMVKPPDFDPDKKYPVLFLVHGGPQGHWSDNFHYRWNMQLFAAPGYVVIAPNPRGSTGYGQKFTDEISQDWGGKVYTDLMNSLDYALENYGFLDEENIVTAGASYGGYMMNWIAGHTDRFNAIVCHAGLFNTVSFWGATEELWFPEWEFGGTPWENYDLYEKWSPHKYIKNATTPMLVIHGGMDMRVPENQAFELFTSLQRLGVPSKFIYYPDENHFITKPQNALFWWNSIFEWFDKYTR